MSDQSKIETLIRVASRLISVLEREVEFLRAMKPAEVAKLHDEKLQLVVAYEEQVRTLAASPDLLRKIAPALQDEFAEIAARFDVAMTQSRRALSAAHEAQERFLKAVIEAAEEKRSSFQAYSAQGVIPGARERNSGKGPLSLTLNTRF